MVSATLIPRERTQRLRERIKRQFGRKGRNLQLGVQLRMLNPTLRGFCNFYRHAWGAKRVFTALDHYLWWTILRWIKKKHGRAWRKVVDARYGWRKPGETQDQQGGFHLAYSTIPTCQDQSAPLGLQVRVTQLIANVLEPAHRAGPPRAG